MEIFAIAVGAILGVLILALWRVIYAQRQKRRMLERVAVALGMARRQWETYESFRKRITHRMLQHPGRATLSDVAQMFSSAAGIDPWLVSASWVQDEPDTVVVSVPREISFRARRRGQLAAEDILLPLMRVEVKPRGEL